MKKILLTGGGTAGHVTPNIALIPYLKEAGFEIEYMGSYDGIEKKLIEEAGIPYHGIDSGKLRRYMSLKNISDPVHILKGLSEAKKYMRKNKPDVVFSKGGFVSVPVIFAAAKAGIPVVIHESDLTPGLANKLSIPKASKICYNFPETKKYLPEGMSVHTGLPVRDELKKGDAAAGLAFCGFSNDKPLLLVIGGSLGSATINDAVRNILLKLLEKFNVAHVCGAGKKDATLEGTSGYRQFEYVSDELPDLFAAANIVVSRAGANVIFEIAALQKPALLIPLGTNASRGDQILNANSFKKRGLAEVLLEDDMTDETLYEKIIDMYDNKDIYINALKKENQGNASEKVCDVIISTLRGGANK